MRHAHALLLSSFVLLAGCATTTRFTVDAVRNSERSEFRKSYRITSANLEMPSEHPLVRRALLAVKTALSSRGMFEAPHATAADMAIEVDFGMSAPETRYTTEVNYANYLPPGRAESLQTVDSGAGTRVQTRNAEGFLVTITRVTTREKFLRVTAREAPSEFAAHPPRELWSVHVVNDDECDALDARLPMLVAAAMDSLGNGAPAPREIDLARNDDRVAFVERGL